MAQLGQRWQRLSRRQQAIAFVGGSALVMWTVNGVALQPLHRRLSQLRREVREIEQRLLRAVIASRQTEAVDQAFQAYGPYVTPVGSPDAELASVLSEVEQAVRQSGMVLLNLKPVNPHDAGDQAISVTVEGEANPSQLVQLLDNLQRSVHLLKVTELTVRVSESSTLRTSMVISKLLLK